MPSLNFRRAAYAAETGRGLIGLITITHPDLTDPVRISREPVQRLSTPLDDIVYGAVSRGETYIYLPTSFKPPDDTDKGPGNMRIEIDNIHRQLTETIRSISSPMLFNVDLVFDNDLDTVERQWPEFLLTNVTWNILLITGTLSLETLQREPFCSGTFSPSWFPGLFK